MAHRSEADERWDRVEQLFHAAMDQPAESRSGFLDEACGGDQGMRREVESLLNAASRGDSLMERPAAEHLGLAESDSARPSPWRSGMAFGHYQILEGLGSGGMGEVFRARDLRLGRDVALKTVPRDLYLDGQYLERLRCEGRALASMNHPNVATVYDIQEVEGRVAVVMELVEGETLARRLTRSRLEMGETLAIAEQICQAVEAAHRKGIIHRDLKPGNVMLARGGLVKVLDFGLAKRGPAPHSQASDATRTAPLTSRGAVLGTPGYMSPEQAEGGEADERSDIFSFGAILYEMASGRVAFEGKTASQRLASVLRDEPSPLEVTATNDGRRLARLVALCLRKNPEERYQSITDVKFALQEIKEESERGATPVASRTTTRRSVVLGGALVGAGAVFSYVATQLRRGDPPPVLVTPLTMYEGYAEAPALSPDGKMVAFNWDGERRDNIDLYLSVIGSGDPLRLTSNPARETRPIWSPDGRSIAFSRLRDSGGAPLATETIFTVPVLGGPETAIGLGYANDWSPDGTAFLALIASGRDAAEWVLLSATDGSSRRLTVTPPGSTMGRGRFSPDGRKVYYVEQTGPAESHLKTVDLAGGTPLRIPISGIQSVGGFAWAGAEELIFAGVTAQSAISRFYRVAASGGTPRESPFGANGGAIDTFPGSRKLVYSQNQLSTNVWRVAAWPGGERQPRKWVSSDSPALTPTVSSSGALIAYGSARSGRWSIWVSDAEGNGATPAVRFPGSATAMVGSPSWSPDGKQIAFDAYIGNYPNVFVTAIGSGVPRPLTQGSARNIIPAWSPDAQWIYYTSSVTGGQTVWRVPAMGGEPRQVTRRGGYSVRISPDGQYLYYLRGRREGELWRAPAEGGEEELLIPEFKSRNFWVLRDGVYLLDSGVTELSPHSRARARFYRFSSQKVQDLGFETDKPVDPYGISLSPDGRWLYYSQADRSGSNVMLVENFR